MDERTDTTKLIVTLLNFENAPEAFVKNGLCVHVIAVAYVTNNYADNNCKQNNSRKKTTWDTTKQVRNKKHETTK
jgi:hypothetical protein